LWNSHLGYTPVGGITETLANGRYGYIVRERNPEVLAEEMLKALLDTRNELLSREVREHVRRIYNFNVCLKLWLKLIKMLQARE
jgi:glycosyltransferase involved in cell wall biosynthesis